MEDNTHQGSAQQDSSEVPSLINYISSNAVAGFDDIKLASFRNDQCQTSKTESLGPSTNVCRIILCLLNRNWHFLIHVSRMISKGPECLNKHVHIIYYYSEIFFPCSARSAVWQCFYVRSITDTYENKKVYNDYVIPQKFNT
jgi:hypothetical protein